jgi:hypothetical protein
MAQIGGQERNSMISVGLKRVSKRRPCRICGKPTYCGYSRDEGTSICMRISAGSRGPSRNGGNIHVPSRDSIHHDSTKLSGRLAQPISSTGSFGNQRRSLSGVNKALSGLELHKGTCHRPRRVDVTRARGPRNQLRRTTSKKTTAYSPRRNLE